MPGPLTGIRILDFSAVLSGPMATAMLADQGAEVIKVEPPEGDTTRMIGPSRGRMSAMYIAANRGKRSIVIDLKQEAGRQLALSLAARCDVLVENFRPGAMARLGLDHAAVSAVTPAIVYLSISGFGQSGPDSGARVYDSVVQAVSGFAAAHREPGTKEPMLLATTLCDKLTALTAAQAITAALFARGRDGTGRRIELSMLDAALAFQWPDAMYNHVFLDDPPPPFPEFGASQRLWKTADGHLATMVPQQGEFAAMCEGLGRPDIPKDPRFASLAMRSRHAAEMRAVLEPLFATLTTQEALARLKATGTPVGRVNERGDVITDPQVVHNGAIAEIDNGAVGRVRLARGAARFDGALADLPGPAPDLGADSRAILADLGFGETEIDRLAAAGTIRVPASR
ncbi:CaiB/BaiF CoA transferase family protein [Phreatobacter sp.]|uniref:CaiB/BaiF CoA transferase family protein n=1 Tax=Phreatobacter sp. TaxID=1966341 RepID=UPI003F70AF28